jgi:ribosomal protein S21
MGRHQKKREKKGLRVDVRYNNVETALKIFKRMIKDSGILLDLKRKTYYEKPSQTRREKKALQALSYKYQTLKDEDSY